MEGKFSLTSIPMRVIVYLEGPDPGVDLLVDHVHVCHCSGPSHREFEVLLRNCSYKPAALFYVINLISIY